MQNATRALKPGTLSETLPFAAMRHWGARGARLYEAPDPSRERPPWTRPPLNSFVADLWREEITPALVDYIRIPAKSPAFDADWEGHGHIDRAVDHMAGWARSKLAELPGATLEVARLPGRTPVIFIESPGEIPGHEGGHRPALRPPRQAARDDRLVGGPRPLGAGDPRRQALWPRRRRRRLRHLRLGGRAPGPRAPRGETRPLRDPDRGPARRAVPSTCRSTSTTWQRVSARRRW